MLDMSFWEKKKNTNFRLFTIKMFTNATFDCVNQVLQNQFNPICLLKFDPYPLVIRYIRYKDPVRP